MLSIRFWVPGLPKTKGSHVIRRRGEGFAVRVNGKIKRAWLPEDTFVVDPKDAAMRAWERAIQAAGLGHFPRQPLEGPWTVEVVFLFPRPQKPKDHTVHIVRPDVDKLSRTVLDACTGKAWIDDAQVGDLSVCKRYADDGKPGAIISLTAARAQESLPL